MNSWSNTDNVFILSDTTHKKTTKQHSIQHRGLLVAILESYVAKRKLLILHQVRLFFIMCNSTSTHIFSFTSYHCKPKMPNLSPSEWWMFSKPNFIQHLFKDLGNFKEKCAIQHWKFGKKKYMILNSFQWDGDFGNSSILFTIRVKIYFLDFFSQREMWTMGSKFPNIPRPFRNIRRSQFPNIPESNEPAQLASSRLERVHVPLHVRIVLMLNHLSLKFY